MPDKKISRKIFRKEKNADTKIHTPEKTCKNQRLRQLDFSF